MEGIEHAHDGLGGEFGAEGVGATTVFNRLQEGLPNVCLQILKDAEEIASFDGEGIDRLNDGGKVKRGHSLGEGFDAALGGEAVDIEDIFFGDSGATEGDHLIEDGLGVAHASVGQAGNGAKCFGGDFYAFGFSDLGKFFDDDLIGDGAKTQTLATGDYGRQDFVGLGSGKDELYVRGRFFEGFEKKH